MSPNSADRDAPVGDEAVAEAMVAALVPEELHTAPGVSLAIGYRPTADRLGGDFYDVIAIDDGNLFIIGDVAGHGLDAARVMASMRSYLRALGFEHGDPATMLEVANGLLADDPRADLVTVVVARWHGPSRTLAVANAGHVAPLLRPPSGPIATIGTDRGPILGSFDASTYPVTEVAVAPDSMLLLYTDGLVERRAGDLAEDTRKLAERWEDEPVPASPDALVDRLMSPVDPDPRDDVAVMAISFGMFETTDPG
jgi:serine phosphatase RsbU (regulator of sigma subunit)